MAKAKKLPSGSWRVRVPDGKNLETGKPKYKSFTADTKKEAEYMAAEYALTRKEKEKPKNLTVGEAIDRYIDENPLLSDSTKVGYRKIRRNNLKPIINLNLKVLSNDIIQASLNEETQYLSPKSIANAYGLLSTVLRIYSPSLRLDLRYPQKKDPQITIPSDEDVAALISAIKGTEMELPVMFAALLGLRRGEIAALTYDDIDFRAGTVRISKAMALTESKQWIVKPPKTNSGNRILPLPANILEVVESRQKAGKPLIALNPDAISNRFERLIKKLDIPHIRYYDMRHYNASVMLALNVPDKYAMERMGHRTNHMLKNVYQHTIDKKQQEIADKINSYMTQNMP